MLDEKSPKQVQIQIGAQYIKDFSFENPSAPQIFNATQAVPEINVSFNIQTRNLAEGAYESALHIKLEAKVSGQIAYIVELAYAGMFILPPLKDEEVKAFLLVEAPRLLFPFSRSLIASIVREAGFAPVMLSPIDFMAFYQSNKDSLLKMSPLGAA